MKYNRVHDILTFGCVFSAFAAVATVAVTSLTVAAEAATPQSGPASAASPVVAPWRVECTSNGKVLDCRTIQQVVQRDDRQQLVPLITLIVHYAPDTRATTMQVQLPLGLTIAEPVIIRIDDGDAERQPIQTCNTSGCYLTMPIGDKILAAMKTGKALRMTVVDSNKKAIELPLPLLGFGIAYDKAK